MTQLAMENVNFSTGDMLGGLIPSDGATWTMGAMAAVEGKATRGEYTGGCASASGSNCFG